MTFEPIDRSSDLPRAARPRTPRRPPGRCERQDARRQRLLAGRFALLLALLFSGVLAALSPVPAAAAPPPWSEASFTYLADNQKLTEVLTRFARTFGLEAQLTDLVRASDVGVSGKITTASPTEFLNQMGAAYGLSWFVQNGVLYVSKSNERATQAIVPPGISSASLKNALTELGIIEPKFGWGEIADRGMALVSGPPAYVRLVAQVVAELPQMAVDQQVQVFKLKHAPVDDRTIFFRDKQITTSGVASILRGLISGQSSGGGTSVMLSELASPLRTGIAPLSSLAQLGNGNSGVGYGAGGVVGNASGNTAGNNAGSSAGGNAGTSAGGDAGSSAGNGGRSGSGGASAPGTPVMAPAAVIQADSRMNSVIIRDRPERMPIYRELIAILDVPSQLIEIEALIVDVNSSSIDQLGVDWSGRIGRLSASVTAGGALSAAATSATLGIEGATGVIGDAANFLLTRINALESRGAARILSRPSILTMDNLGALIDLSETFYIQSVGERVSNVTPVSVGVTLNVTPHIVEGNGRRSIQLVVDIEDGSIQDRQIQSLPTVRRSTIGTQAVMGERESLLIGGFNSEQNVRQKDGVPVLGRMPFIGPLFSKTSTTVERRERLFVITPRIVPVDSSGMPVSALSQSPAPRTVLQAPANARPAGLAPAAGAVQTLPVPQPAVPSLRLSDEPQSAASRGIEPAAPAGPASPSTSIASPATSAPERPAALAPFFRVGPPVFPPSQDRAPRENPMQQNAPAVTPIQEGAAMPSGAPAIADEALPVDEQPLLR
jgi:type III secretion protein C